MRVDASIQAYVSNFERAFPQTNVKVHSGKRGFRVFIDGSAVGEPMTRDELEESSRTFRAPAPRPPVRATAKLGDIARFKGV